MLATINILSASYAIKLIHQAKSVYEAFLSTFALIGAVFVLVVVDAISIVLLDGRTDEPGASRCSSPADHEASLQRRT